MTTATPDSERALLQHIDERLEAFKASLLSQIDDEVPVDREFIARSKQTTSRLAATINKSLPLTMAPAMADEIRRTMLEALTEIDTADPDRPLDALDHLLLRLEQIRHAVRDALDESLGVDETDASEVARRLSALLPRTPQATLADLVGLSLRQFQRILKDGGHSSSRLLLVARLVVLLERAWTPEGVVAWFRRKRPELDGHRPLDVLDDPDYEEMLMVTARQGRAGHGA